MMMTHSSCATLLDHDDIMYSPFLFAVRRDLSQSAGGPWERDGTGLMPLLDWASEQTIDSPGQYLVAASASSAPAEPPPPS